MSSRTLVRPLGLAGLLGLVAGLLADAPVEATAPPSEFAITVPSADATFDVQLGGAYPPAANVDVVIRDRADPPEPGRYNICYVNAFQTQPGEAEMWAEHPRLVLRDGERAVIDPAWPDEMILAPVGPRRQAALLAIVGPWIDRCAADGFDAVEFDNLDTFTRFPDRILEIHAVDYATRLVARAHAAGLAAAQKNTAELLPRRSEIGFDLVITEGCSAFGECVTFAAAAPGLVFDIEYDDEGLAAACAVEPPIAVVRRDLDLRPAGAPGHVRATCPD